ncbi:MAG: alpha/beta fold hydrolase [Planctomycetaceae bacterium]
MSITLEEIFHAAIEIPAGPERESFLVRACEGNSVLLQDVQSLLRANDTDSHLLERPIVLLNGTETRIEGTSWKPAPSLAPGFMLGRFEIRSLLGSGGMGEVYLAYDPQLDRQIAIKVLFPKHSADSQWLARFRREARSASSVNHPGILTIYEVGESQGTHYIATEYIEGETLRSRLHRGQIPLSEVIVLATQISAALAAAHEAGVIHRDLKPENVMIRRDGLVKVLDFGLARSSEGIGPGSRVGETPVTFSGLLAGTLGYMSPEQARGQKVDHRSDLFSLGVLLFEMVNGHLPFIGATQSDVLVAILDRPAPAIDRSGTVIPDELKQLVDRLLTKEVSARSLTARHVTEELRALKSLPLTDAAAPAPTNLASGTSVSRSEPTIVPGSDSGRIPDVRYAASGDVNIAYQVFGSGDFDIVFVMGWVSHLEWFWKDPSFARFLRDLGTFARVILFDKRGTGLSDRVPVHQLPTLEQRMDDVRAVMEAVDSQRAVLCGVSEGGPLCALFAATYPEKTIAMVMIGSYARRLWAEDYPYGVREEHRLHFLEEIRRNWGGPVGIDDRAPSMAHDPQFRDWWATYLRMGASPGAALALTQMNAQIDIRPILPLIRVPTLVIHRMADRCLKVEEGRYLADNIPGAEFCELPGDDHLPFVGNQSEILQEIRRFLMTRSRQSHVERILATILASSIAPQKTRSGGMPESFRNSVRDEVALYRGSNVVFSDDLVLAAFDGPSRAIRAALSITWVHIGTA